MTNKCLDNLSDYLKAVTKTCRFDNRICYTFRVLRQHYVVLRKNTTTDRTIYDPTCDICCCFASPEVTPSRMTWKVTMACVSAIRAHLLIWPRFVSLWVKRYL